MRAARRARVGGADHQHAAGGAVADGRHRLGWRQLRRGDQGRHLRQRRGGVLRPAADLADVDEADRPLGDARRALGLLVQVDEEPALLGAGDEQRRRRSWPRAGTPRPRAGRGSSGPYRARRPLQAPGPGSGPVRPGASSCCSRRSGSSSRRVRGAGAPSDCATAAPAAPSGDAATGTAAAGRSAASSSISNRRSIFDWLSCRSIDVGNRIGLAVVVDVGVETVHDVEVRVAEQLAAWRRC